MKAVLFDLGRVLVHYDHARTVAGLAAVCSASEADVRQIVNELHMPLETGAISGEDLHAALRERAGAVEDPVLFEESFTSGLSRDDAALSYALQLEEREGVLVAVISNTTDAHVRWLDQNVPELREFDLVIMSNEVGMRKPDEAIYRLALELLGVAPVGALFIDDLPINVESAQALGMAGIVHLDWAITRAALEEWLAA